MLIGGERGLWHRAQFFIAQQRRALVVERHAVRFHIVKPHLIGAAGVGLGKEQDGGGDSSIGLKHTARQRDNRVELLILDQHLAQALVRVA